MKSSIALAVYLVLIWYAPLWFEYGRLRRRSAKQTQFDGGGRLA